MRHCLLAIIFMMHLLCSCAYDTMSCPKNENSLEGIGKVDYQEGLQEQITCAGKNIAYVLYTELPNGGYRYLFQQANNGPKQIISYKPATEDVIIISDVNGKATQHIPLDSIMHDGPGPIQFLDFNQDGYADIWVVIGGTLNAESKIYVWDSGVNQYIEVVYDDILSYFEVYDGYVKNWIKDGAKYMIVQTLVWSDAHTLCLDSETVIDLEADSGMDT